MSQLKYRSNREKWEISDETARLNACGFVEYQRVSIKYRRISKYNGILRGASMKKVTFLHSVKV
ncbi:hypothetical protein CWR48_02685 [Oceanobacillus arenosus]|uniref:Uncharacterized protein n=1 Tax=Oceanobacillus arenosus TaxID=1229153 RepID=A0A3D8Q2N9_9BACI|nr:hypothetical protein CWR48_02685 [Oceanobacillus arenosus]